MTTEDLTLKDLSSHWFGVEEYNVLETLSNTYRAEGFNCHIAMQGAVIGHIIVSNHPLIQCVFIFPFHFRTYTYYTISIEPSDGDPSEFSGRYYPWSSNGWTKRYGQRGFIKRFGDLDSAISELHRLANFGSNIKG